jgi:predicted ATPase
VLWGLCLFYTGRGELQSARELGEQGLALAQRQDDATLLLEAHAALGSTLLYLGEFASARSHAEQGLALYDPQRHRHLAYQGAGLDVAVLCLGCPIVHSLWYLGYPSQALQRSREAVTLAQGLAHPLSLAAALSWNARFHQLRREPQVVHELADAIIALATAQGFAQWLAQGIVLRGWALAERGQAVEGVTEILQGLATWRATGAEVGRQWRLLLLAEAYGKMGQTAEGLATLAEALAVVERTGDRRDEAEIHRLKGEFLLRQAVPAAPQAETCFRQALDVAHRQEAKALELRTAMSLSRLWQHQGKRAEAYELLAPIYSWFTEGLDTADLQEAKALLAALA